MSNDAANKSSRILELYQEFIAGKTIKKADAAMRYGVTPRSVQRDIDAIRDFLSEQTAANGILQSIEYDKSANGYRLVTQNINYLSNGEILAICKILLSSRSMSKAEIASLLNRLLQLCVSPKDKADIEYYFRNEIHNYIDPAHASPDLELIWRTAKAIRETRLVEVSYTRLKQPEAVTRTLEPVGILFSEYYFYLMGVITDAQKRLEFERVNDPFPTIYRLDRITSLKVLDKRFSVPYIERFEEGKYKNTNQFMFGGEPQRLVFSYTGMSIESVMDRLPTADVKAEADGSYTVNADIFGKGILMWLLSQGRNVEVKAPSSLRSAWLNEAQFILNRQEEEKEI